MTENVISVLVPELKKNDVAVYLNKSNRDNIRTTRTQYEYRNIGYLLLLHTVYII